MICAATRNNPTESLCIMCCELLSKADLKIVHDWTKCNSSSVIAQSVLAQWCS